MKLDQIFGVLVGLTVAWVAPWNHVAVGIVIVLVGLVLVSVRAGLVYSSCCSPKRASELKECFGAGLEASP